MILSKNQFFLGLLFLLAIPYFIYKIGWFNKYSKKTTGRIIGIGHNTGMSLGESSYSLVQFNVGERKIVFNGDDENFKESDTIAVRYCEDDPQDARINTMLSNWSDGFVYGALLVIFWLVPYIMKDVLPHPSKLLIGSKPFIKIINKDA